MGSLSQRSDVTKKNVQLKALLDQSRSEHRKELEVGHGLWNLRFTF